MASKRTRGMRFAKAIGMPCAYCRRAMTVMVPGLLPTLDHVHPRSRGGKETVWACDDCNHLKRDMTISEWAEFMKRNPGWWGQRGRLNCIETLISGKSAENDTTKA
jgi:hypothetical protein